MAETFAKRFIFRNKGFLTGTQVSEVLSSIQKIGKKVKDRTPVADELGYWGNSYPIPIPPVGDALIFRGLTDVDDGQLSVEFLKKTNMGFFQNVFDKISPWANIHFQIPLKQPKFEIEDLRASLTFESRVAYFGFRFLQLRSGGDDETMSLANEVQKIIALAGLPLSLKCKPRSFVLSHKDKEGEIFRPRRDTSEIPTIIQCSFPRLDLKEIVSRFLAFVQNQEFRAGAGEWSIGILRDNLPNPKDPEKLLSEINRAGFPGKKAKCVILWHLKDYTCFEQMPLMTKLKREGAVQSLLEFEFAGGRKCQLDILCNARDKFKLFFSFDKPEEMEPLAELLKLKLESH